MGGWPILQEIIPLRGRTCKLNSCKDSAELNSQVRPSVAIERKMSCLEKTVTKNEIKIKKLEDAIDSVEVKNKKLEADLELALQTVAAVSEIVAKKVTEAVVGIISNHQEDFEN